MTHPTINYSNNFDNFIDNIINSNIKCCRCFKKVSLVLNSVNVAMLPIIYLDCNVQVLCVKCIKTTHVCEKNIVDHIHHLAGEREVGIFITQYPRSWKEILLLSFAGIINYMHLKRYIKEFNMFDPINKNRFSSTYEDVLVFSNQLSVIKEGMCKFHFFFLL